MRKKSKILSYFILPGAIRYDKVLPDSGSQIAAFSLITAVGA